jgi:hypothetical protein
VFGSGYSSSQKGPREDASRPATESNVIRAPELGPALPPDVHAVPDPEIREQPKPIQRAPQLLDPRDKVAGGDQRWAVVPAVWPNQ